MKRIKFISLIILTWIAYPFLIKKADKVLKELGDQKRILVIPQLSRIGDIVCSTPVFYNIKKKYPHSHLSVLVSKKALGIIKNNPRIDSFILIEDFPGNSLIKKLREEKFNYSISLNATSTSTYWTIWSYIPHRIKTIVETPPITERMTDWMANHRLLYKNHTYLPLHHIRLLKFLDIDIPNDVKEIYTTKYGENKASIYIKSLNLKPGSKIIGLSITAGNKIKELGDLKFKELALKILSLGNTAIVTIGSKGDTQRLEEFVKSVNHPKCFYTTDFNLEELPSLIKEFSIYIAVDTGPIYIAHALGTPLIDIIGPVDPKEQPPKDERAIQVLPRGNIKPSSFVFKRRGPDWLIKKALDNTYIEDIFSAVLRFLKN
jgi:heptosyltransferase II